MKQLFIPDTELDFHNRGSLHPFDIETLLNNFLEDSYISGKKQLLIITGKGPVVRPLVKEILSKSSMVKGYSYAGAYNDNEGAFEVEL